jgi:hypothetical protein
MFDIVRDALERAAASFAFHLQNTLGLDPGEHRHTEQNPFGLHKHEAGEEMGGGHIHTAQNPMGEHFHGSNDGMRLAHGGHLHKDGNTGPHFHPNDIPKDFIPVINPSEDSNL